MATIDAIQQTTCKVMTRGFKIAQATSNLVTSSRINAKRARHKQNSPTPSKPGDAFAPTGIKGATDGIFAPPSPYDGTVGAAAQSLQWFADRRIPRP